MKGKILYFLLLGTITVSPDTYANQRPDFSDDSSSVASSSSLEGDNGDAMTVEEQFNRGKTELIAEMREFLDQLSHVSDRIRVEKTTQKVTGMLQEALRLQMEQGNYPLSPLYELQQRYDYVTEYFRECLPVANEIAQHLENLPTSAERNAALEEMDGSEADAFVFISLKELNDKLEAIAWLPTILDMNRENADEIEKLLRRIAGFLNWIEDWQGLATVTSEAIHAMSQRTPLRPYRVFKLADQYLRQVSRLGLIRH